MLCSSPQDKSSLSQKALAGVVLNPVWHTVRREQGFLVLVTRDFRVGTATFIPCSVPRAFLRSDWLNCQNPNSQIGYERGSTQVLMIRIFFLRRRNFLWFMLAFSNADRGSREVSWKNLDIQE